MGLLIFPEPALFLTCEFEKVERKDKVRESVGFILRKIGPVELKVARATASSSMNTIHS